MYTPKLSCAILLTAMSGIAFGSSLSAQSMLNEDRKFGDVIVRASIDQPGTVNKHRLHMHVNREYHITLQTQDSAKQAALRVLNDKGVSLGQSNGQGKIVLEYSPQQNGEFSLAILGSPPRALGPYSLTIRMAIGFRSKTFTDQLTPNDAFDKVRGNCRCKIHPLRLHAGKSYQIDMTANFDTYIRIEDSTGRNLAQNDDGGVGLNSRLTFRPSRTDTYRIIATTFSSRHMGKYKLTVRRLDVK